MALKLELLGRQREINLHIILTLYRPNTYLQSKFEKKLIKLEIQRGKTSNP